MRICHWGSLEAGTDSVLADGRHCSGEAHGQRDEGLARHQAMEKWPPNRAVVPKHRTQHHQAEDPVTQTLRASNPAAPPTCIGQMKENRGPEVISWPGPSHTHQIP